MAMDMVELVTLVDKDLVMDLVQGQVDLEETQDYRVQLVLEVEIHLVIMAVEIVWEQLALEMVTLRVTVVVVFLDKELLLEVTQDQVVLGLVVPQVITLNNNSY